MNLLSCLISPILMLSSSSYAMELSSPEIPSTVKKRGAESTNPQKIQKHQKIDIQSEEENQSARAINLEKMKKRLEYKATILTKSLPDLMIELKTIQDALEKIAREKYASHPENLPRASELVSYASGIRIMVNSTEQLLHKLRSRNYDNKNDLVSVSMAILASGTLPPKIDAITKFLSQSEDTQDIKFEGLTTAYHEIYEITEDLPNPVLSRSRRK
ncbi:hypothetical protein [Candidatus Odyssella acanthamoebae]|uniref:Uncharacterized protein n=1 Tax=Candidatus Odyssella acanthamoebae TaxID=91604 RepID=A0A077AT82_9PROT|nr:hypothetical protein [Candidatus Paracaedibacter acanthamoebae]AIK96397.1 hypothetical protein ID47_06085 [Candidatus Paracaedibacter acanthamoebae]